MPGFRALIEMEFRLTMDYVYLSEGTKRAIFGHLFGRQHKVIRLFGIVLAPFLALAIMIKQA